MSFKKLPMSVHLIGLFFIIYLNGFSRSGMYQNKGFFDPDSLTPVTVMGTAIVDSSMSHTMYFLDENGDGNSNYIINLGPDWYEPDSSKASRPNDGDTLKISGGRFDLTGLGLPVIVVYEINGEFWRDPYDPFWTYLGIHSHAGDHHQHQGGMTGFAFGWMHDTLNVDTLKGTVLIDTTLIMKHYYLDVNNDNQSDYFLNFGPPWYQPASEISRPEEGDIVEILGGIIDRQTFSMAIVFEINGLVWRDSTDFGHHFGGEWIYHNMSTPQLVHAIFDTSDRMYINPDWYPEDGHQGMMIPDTLFCQMLELYPQNMPNPGNLNIFAGYEMGIFFPNGMNGMWQSGRSGHMNFAAPVKFQLHYNDVQIQGMNIDERTIEARYWNKNTNSWLVVPGTVVNPAKNTVNFQQNEISTYLILSGQEAVTTINDKQKLLADRFLLKQNYPNPFNPETQIEFVLEKNAKVELSVFNILGQKLNTLVNKSLTAGVHSIRFDGRNLPSGIYFYQLRTGNQTQVRKMELLK